MKRLAIAVLFFLVAVACRSEYRFFGRVCNPDSEPVKANVAIDSLAVFTDEDGRYEIKTDDLTPREIIISVPLRKDELGIETIEYFPVSKKAYPEEGTDVFLEECGYMSVKYYDYDNALIRPDTLRESGIKFYDSFDRETGIQIIGEDDDVPADYCGILVPLGQMLKVSVVYWIPGLGSFRMSADNEGKFFSFGYRGEVIAVNLNYEIAKTLNAEMLTVFQKYMDDGMEFSEKILEGIAECQEWLNKAAEKTADDKECALYSDKCVKTCVKVMNRIEFEKSRQQIDVLGRQVVELKIVDEKNNPVTDDTAYVSQESSDFIVGAVDVVKPEDKAVLKSLGFENTEASVYASSELIEKLDFIDKSAESLLLLLIDQDSGNISDKTILFRRLMELAKEQEPAVKKIAVLGDVFDDTSYLMAMQIIESKVDVDCFALRFGNVRKDYYLATRFLDKLDRFAILGKNLYLLDFEVPWDDTVAYDVGNWTDCVLNGIYSRPFVSGIFFKDSESLFNPDGSVGNVALQTRDIMSRWNTKKEIGIGKKGEALFAGYAGKYNIMTYKKELKGTFFVGRNRGNNLTVTVK